MISSPPTSWSTLGPLDVHFDGLAYVVGIAAALAIGHHPSSPQSSLHKWCHSHWLGVTSLGGLTTRYAAARSCGGLHHEHVAQGVATADMPKRYLTTTFRAPVPWTATNVNSSSRSRIWPLSCLPEGNGELSAGTPAGIGLVEVPRTRFARWRLTPMGGLP